TQLDIVIGNILSNAVKYSNMNGKISIIIEDYSNSKYRISIKDNGIGIPKEQQVYIFGRLFRADNAKKVDTDGNGLGLYIVKKIVEAMNGDVWFISKKDEGTEFIIELPYKIQ
ncbi:ATP-binding protein, partial [bacterium]|nr:ATP-binding protein [bacterium]